mmetsp:Transcript_6449/g.18463  ORF Transcript_6449/g.18463 Transcript_6449/m.18463 type:complete len:690 (-) Transcript_6449:569-2638(-)
MSARRCAEPHASHGSALPTRTSPRPRGGSAHLRRPCGRRSGWRLRLALRHHRRGLGLGRGALPLRHDHAAALRLHLRLLHHRRILRADVPGRLHRRQGPRRRREASLEAALAARHHSGHARPAQRLPGVRVLERQRELQWLLRPLVDYLLPELALVAHAVELALDVLLRDLEEPENRVVRLLADQVEDAPVLLGRRLSPDLFHPGGEVLRTVLPIEQFHIDVQFLLRAVVHPRAREDTHNLAQLHGSASELGHVVLQALEGLFLHLLVELLVHSVEILLQPLLILRALPLQSAQVVAVLADVHIVGGALHRNAVHLVPEFVDVSFSLSARALQAADAKVERVQALRRLLGDVRVVALDAVHAVVDLFVQVVVLLAKDGLELRNPRGGLGVLFVELAMDLLMRLRMLHGRQLQLPRLRLVRLEALRHLGLRLLHEPLTRLRVRVHLVDHVPDLPADLVDRLVDLPPPAVDLQPERRCHVPDGLDGRVHVVVHVIPCGDVRLGIEFRLRLVSQLGDILSQLVAALVRLLQALGHVLHPSIVRFQRFLHVAHVESHGGDLGCHRRLDALPRSDDGVRGVNTCAHLVQIDIDRIHRGGEVLHVALASQDDALHMGGVVLRTVHEVLQLADVVLQSIYVMRIGLHARAACAWSAARRSRLGAHEGDLLLDVRGHELQLARHLRLEVAHPIRHLL